MSNNYRDYVIKDGKLVGQFDQMYVNSHDIPWHQDETAYRIFGDMTICILNFFHKQQHFTSLLEVGCGLGYIVNRIYHEVDSKIHLTGTDISANATEKAQQLFPYIQFEKGNILEDVPQKYQSAFDVVMTKDTLWYVLDNLEAYFDNLAQMSKKYIYIHQSFPASSQFLGSDIFPNPKALEQYVSNKFEVEYSLLEYNKEYDKTHNLHLILTKKNN